MRLLLLVSCACAVAHASPFSIPPRGDPGTKVDATGSFAAAPRQDWPCALRKRFEGDEWRVNLRFVYGARKTCRLPIGLADEGITGCVERTVTKSPRDKRNYDLHRVSYANDGTVERVDSNMGSTSYTWTGDVPSSRDQYAPVRSPGRLSYKGITSSTVGRRRSTTGPGRTRPAPIASSPRPAARRWVRPTRRAPSRSPTGRWRLPPGS